MTHFRLFCNATLAFIILFGTVAAGQDWSQWRGPDRDGAVPSFQLPEGKWPERLIRRWTVEVGQGYAAPLLIGDRIYSFTRQDDDEVMQALDASSGETIWRSAYPALFEMNPGTRYHGPGPKSTPVFADDRLFT